MSKPLIGIVLVNYNGHDLTIKTIESIFASGYPNVEIIVVDNKSIDDSIDLIEKNTLD
ncbi:MAG: glycosyltransferase [Lachnospiraceae bacterium]|nr:glycosyltransferase [Lachnospiraceae bacterium]